MTFSADDPRRNNYTDVIETNGHLEIVKPLWPALRATGLKNADIWVIELISGHRLHAQKVRDPQDRKIQLWQAVDSI